MRFEPLIRCDVDGCEALVEPHVLRCGQHRAARGPLTTARAGTTPPQGGPLSAGIRKWQRVNGDRVRGKPRRHGPKPARVPSGRHFTRRRKADPRR